MNGLEKVVLVLCIWSFIHRTTLVHALDLPNQSLPANLGSPSQRPYLLRGFETASKWLQSPASDTTRHKRDSESLERSEETKRVKLNMDLLAADVISHINSKIGAMTQAFPISPSSEQESKVWALKAFLIMFIGAVQKTSATDMFRGFESIKGIVSKMDDGAIDAAIQSMNDGEWRWILEISTSLPGNLSYLC